MERDTQHATDEESENTKAYVAPAIEEVVTREGLEREVAYAGVIGGSTLNN